MLGLSLTPDRLLKQSCVLKSSLQQCCILEMFDLDHVFELVNVCTYGWDFHGDKTMLVLCACEGSLWFIVCHLYSQRLGIVMVDN